MCVSSSSLVLLNWCYSVTYIYVCVCVFEYNTGKMCWKKEKHTMDKCNAMSSIAQCSLNTKMHAHNNTDHKLKAHRPHFYSFSTIKFMVTYKCRLFCGRVCCYWYVFFLCLFFFLSVLSCRRYKTVVYWIVECTHNKGTHVLWWTAICRWCENYIRCCILWKLVNICIGRTKHVQYAIGRGKQRERVNQVERVAFHFSNCKAWKSVLRTV